MVELCETGALELYDLKNDLSEASDLAEKMPEKVREMRRLLVNWRKEVNAQMPLPNPEYKK